MLTKRKRKPLQYTDNKYTLTQPSSVVKGQKRKMKKGERTENQQQEQEVRQLQKPNNKKYETGMKQGGKGKMEKDTEKHKCTQEQTNTLKFS